MRRTELVEYLDTLLNRPSYKDYCPNGIQVEGRSQVNRVVCGVTASLALIEAAILREADTIIVHHGYFWRGEDPCITGLRRTRIGALVKNDINLLAYHLPLDLHPELGNNAQLAKVLDWRIEGQAGEQNLIFYGRPTQDVNLQQLCAHISQRLSRQPLSIGDIHKPIRKIAWCTGGAQSYFEQALNLGVDVFVSGEISEPTVHMARESGVAYIAAGHHATERYGIRAIGDHLQTQFGLSCEFIDIDNPV